MIKEIQWQNRNDKMKGVRKEEKPDNDHNNVNKKLLSNHATRHTLYPTTPLLAQVQ